MKSVIESRGAPKTILIVEDDFIIRETLREALENEGYRVVAAENGQDGLEKIKLLPKPLLVLLDMMMPIMGGREFLDNVMADSYLAPIPVIIVSATVGSDTKGAASVMKKPIDLDILLDMVSRIVDKA